MVPDLLQTCASFLHARPILVLALVMLPLVALAWRYQIYPHQRLLQWLILPVLLSIGLLITASPIHPYLINGMIIVDIAIVLLALFDLSSLPRHREFSVDRNCQRTASLRKSHSVSLTLNNLGRRQRSAMVRDGVPEEFEVVPDMATVDLPPLSRAIIQYRLYPTRRGAFSLDHVYVQSISRRGLWKRLIRIPCQSAINVFPDMKQLAEFELLARTNRLSLMGVRRTRRVGQDNDFERLRDYTLDDNYKHIDWRSTARRQKLTVKDFQTSQSQRLIFLVDCGRMMSSRVAGLSMLDHSLNAMLMLSYIALRRGDSVGLLCFSDEVRSFVPPRSGASQMNHLIRASFDQFPMLVESHYQQAFLHVATHCRKRSLVVLITNVIDEVNSYHIQNHLGAFVGRHLPLLLLLRDRDLFAAVDSNWHDDREMYRAAAAAEILSWRQQVLNDVQQKGVLTLDLFPDQMTAPLINQYLEVKARHLL